MSTILVDTEAHGDLASSSLCDRDNKCLSFPLAGDLHAPLFSPIMYTRSLSSLPCCRFS